MTRPNILFLMSDEHRPDVTGYEGNDVIRTPFLNKLAEDGIVFRNAYTPSPSCIPARQSLMSGQLPRTTGCERYGEDLSPNYMTFSRRLSQYGYTTAVSGKLHHTGPDQMQGWTCRIAGDMEMTAKNIEGLERGEYNKYVPAHKQKWSNSKEIKRAGIGEGPCNVNDRFWVDGALKFIEQYFNDPYYDREQTRPLLLKVSLTLPHYPFFTSADKFNYYLNRVKPYLNEEIFDHPFFEFKRVIPGKDVSEREIRRATAAYYGMIETMDGYLSQIADALKYVGQNLDDWIIIYTSDHGDLIGEHNNWEKSKFFEGSARVPLIIRWPKKFTGGRVVEENVNLCDLFATLCDLTGIPLPEGLDSRSMVPLMNGDGTGWNNESISQLSQHDGRHLMIKQHFMKYQYYSGMPEVLFDLHRNPEETINYIEDPAYKDQVAYFRKRCSELGYGEMADPDYVNAGYGK
ncbi:MAG: hypothetical protein K0R75_690 [Paenibacillaceae bacterium]|jgi:choline-sulfatase|nr:hypothetical protein [Paenibacillaceae bacterium]